MCYLPSSFWSTSTTLSPVFHRLKNLSALVFANMSLDINKYTGQIRDILSAPGIDLTTISAKRVRKQLVEQNEDLTPELVKEHKGELDTLIGSVYEEVSGGTGEGQDDEDSVKRKHEDGEDEVDEGTPAPKRSKNNTERSDAELARKLSKALNGRERGARAAAPKAKAKRGKKGAKSAAVVDSDGEGNETKPKRKGGFTKEYILRCAPVFVLCLSAY